MLEMRSIWRRWIPFPPCIAVRFDKLLKRLQGHHRVVALTVSQPPSNHMTVSIGKAPTQMCSFSG